MTKRESKRIVLKTVATEIQSLLESEVWMGRSLERDDYTAPEIGKLNAALESLADELWRRSDRSRETGGAT